MVVAGVQEETLARPAAARVCSGRTSSRRPPGAGEWGDSQGADVDVAMLSAKLLAEERFYCSTSRRLGAPAAGRHRRGEDGHRPAAVQVPHRAGGRRYRSMRVTGGGTHRWLSLPCWSPTRRAAADTARPPTAVREAAAAAGQAGRRRGPRGAPAGVVRADRAVRGHSIVAGGEAVRLSPSQVESFTRCGLRWLLEAAVGAGRLDVLRHLGTVIHAAGGTGHAASGATEQAVADRIDEICTTWTSAAPGTAPSSGRWPSGWSAGSSTGTPPTRCASSSR